MMIYLDLIYVIFLSQSRRSKFEVAGGKCSVFGGKWTSESGKTRSGNVKEKHTWVLETVNKISNAKVVGATSSEAFLVFFVLCPRIFFYWLTE